MGGGGGGEMGWDGAVDVTDKTLYQDAALRC